MLNEQMEPPLTPAAPPCAHTRARIFVLPDSHLCPPPLSLQLVIVCKITWYDGRVEKTPKCGITRKPFAVFVWTSVGHCVQSTCGC